MESLKQGLSFLLFAAAAWFVYIYMGMINQDAVMMMLIGLTMGYLLTDQWEIAHGTACALFQNEFYKYNKKVGYL